MPHEALRAAGHRPSPLPPRPWLLTMDWEDLVFLHWRVEAGGLQRVLPPALEVETYDGSAWLGVVPFRMARTRVRWLPPLPGAHTFPELNVRTYVRDARRSGVWFFSLDAHSRLAVASARAVLRLPYRYARMSCTRTGDRVDYTSERIERTAPRATFRAAWREGPTWTAAAPGSLEHFLCERYRMFTPARRGPPACVDVAHAPWLLSPATAEIHECDVTREWGIVLDRAPDSVLAARRQRVAAWWPES